MELQTFTNQELGFSLRYVLDANGDPWFPARKIALDLEYTNSNLTIQKHVPSQDKSTLEEVLTKKVGYNSDTRLLTTKQKNTICINEAGLYTLIMKSKMKKAVEFQGWVCREVLPSIRKTGSYTVPKPKEVIDSATETDTSSAPYRVSLYTLFDTNEVDVNSVVDDDGNYWFNARHLAKALGFKSTNSGINKNVHPDEKKTLQDLQPNIKLTYNKATSIYITEDAAYNLILKTQTVDALNLAQRLNMRQDTKFVRKEIEIVSFIQEFLATMDIECIFQFSCGGYRIDLYMPESKLAVEIDEHNHSGRDQEHEQERENFLKRMLGCSFLRFNPDAADFKLSTCVGEIAKRLELISK